MKICPRCHGSGSEEETVVVEDFLEGGKQTVVIKTRCSYCYGSGYIEEDDTDERER